MKQFEAADKFWEVLEFISKGLVPPKPTWTME